MNLTHNVCCLLPKQNQNHWKFYQIWVRTSVGAGINRVSDWVYAYMPTQFHFFKNPDPLLPSNFWKFNTRHHLIITDDLKNLKYP
jgi:hypothetical protein